MLDPILRSFFVAIVVALLKLGADYLGIPNDPAVLTALAIAIIGKILGDHAGARTAQAFIGDRRSQ